MISRGADVHDSAGELQVVDQPLGANTSGVPTASADHLARLRSVFRAHFDFVWRSLRRAGLQRHEADDASQQVFMVVSRRLADIEVGRERSFLFATAMRLASDVRRARGRCHEIASDQLDQTRGGSTPEELVDQKKKRELLDEILNELPDDLRAVIILFELEGMSLEEMARCLEIPQGTVASRLRRGREQFQAIVKRRMLRSARRGGGSYE